MPCPIVPSARCPGAWINLLALCYLGDASVGKIRRSLGRRLNFDFSRRDQFARSMWLKWAKRARGRAVFFLDKLSRQEGYANLRASSLMRTQYSVLSQACFVPICTNLLSPWLCAEDESGANVMKLNPALACWGTNHQIYCMMALFALSLYLPCATMFAAFANTDSNGPSLGRLRVGAAARRPHAPLAIPCRPPCALLTPRTRLRN